MSTSETVIRVENLGKRYRIGTNKPPAKTLGGKLKNTLTSPFEWLEKQMRPPTEEETLWALKDISFEVNRGDVVGIIGRNGAGKSTLLKILSRITEPSTGFAEIKGRVGALLEVGTGMHPELTGRENIYQNGCILGMRKWEIDKKFDEIVDFSGIERFIDTPVKRYSSGQRVRLGFAIAAHLEPEILVVDEVLAVGDIEFQEKCIGKMKDVAGRGRTVLFVSHNMAAINSLCTRAILLENSTVNSAGTVESCINIYKRTLTTLNKRWIRSETNLVENPLSFDEVALEIIGSQPNFEISLDLKITSYRKHPSSFIAVDVQDSTGTVIMQAIPTLDQILEEFPREKSLHISIQLPPLIPGQYSISLWAGPHNTDTADYIKSILGFEITESPTPGRSFPHTSDKGSIVPPSTLNFSKK